MSATTWPPECIYSAEVMSNAFLLQMITILLPLTAMYVLASKILPIIISHIEDLPIILTVPFEMFVSRTYLIDYIVEQLKYND